MAFRSYLFGRLDSIYTGHKPLEWLLSLKESNSHLVRWTLKLQLGTTKLNKKNWPKHDLKKRLYVTNFRKTDFQLLSLEHFKSVGKIPTYDR